MLIKYVILKPSFMARAEPATALNAEARLRSFEPLDGPCPVFTFIPSVELDELKGAFERLGFNSANGSLELMIRSLRAVWTGNHEPEHSRLEVGLGNIQSAALKRVASEIEAALRPALLKEVDPSISSDAFMALAQGWEIELALESSKRGLLLAHTPRGSL